MDDLRRRFLAYAMAIAVAPAHGAALPTRYRKRVTLFFYGEGDIAEAEREYRALLAQEGFEEPRNVTIDVAVARTPAEAAP